MSRRSAFRTAFGAALDEQLRARGMRQADLAKATKKTPSYINQTITGTRPAAAKWINTVATALKLAEAERIRLHVAAAYDAGYDVPDLTPPARKPRA